MNSQPKNNQPRQGAKVDDQKSSKPSEPVNNDKNFLTAENATKTYPNNQNNPSDWYNETSPKRISNPNIGGDESEYETSVEDEDRYNYGISEHDDEIVNRRDNEEIDRHDDETRYSDSHWGNYGDDDIHL